MRILADENIPYAEDAFSCFGDVATIPGRLIRREHLQGVNTLLVRTVTQVGSDLLQDTDVSFVGSATSGFDHVDVDYLNSRGTYFTYAPGSNARSVAEYVLAAIPEHTGDDTPLTHLRCAIIGFGRVGRAVHQLLAPLGLDCVAVDPFVEQPQGGPDFVPFERVSDCDIITFHVPLTTDGSHPTRHMIDAPFLASLNDDALLINAARGGVADSHAIIRAKRQRPGLKLVLDVFENEPEISPELVESCDTATPHIAGYSWDAKLEGTRQLFEALNEWKMTAWSFPEIPDAPPPSVAKLSAPESAANVTAELRSAIRQAYDLRADDHALRQGIERAEGNIGAVFDTLRKSYGPRREFTAVRFATNDWSPEAAAHLRALGFGME